MEAFVADGVEFLLTNKAGFTIYFPLPSILQEYLVYDYFIFHSQGEPKM